MEKFIKEVLNKGKAENADAKDRQKMLALFHQAEYEYELKGDLLEELQNSESTNTPSPNSNKQFDKLWAKINVRKRDPRLKIINNVLKIAAAVVIGLFIGLYITSINTIQEPIYYAAHSPRGSVSEMILPDGSVIFLNSDSRIQYSFDGKNGIREVHLNGEALFNVEKNKKKPFIVHTPFYDINVTGTQFNVKAYDLDNNITTTLE